MEHGAQRVLVTGGAGFIGSHLCEALAQGGRRVISLDNYFTGSRQNHVAGVDYREGSTSDIEERVPEPVDLVYHLGEYSRVETSFEDVARVLDANMRGTAAVLSFCRARGAKLVYAGSSTKFGDGGLGRDQSPYAWTKAANTELVRNWGAWFGLRYAITYFYNVYGGREIAHGRYATLIARFKERYREGLPLEVVVPGTQRRNFTHISDIIEGLMAVGAGAEGDDYGIGNGTAYSILEVARLFGATYPVVMLPLRPGNRQTSSIDTSRARSLGWEPRVELRDHVAEFIAATPRV